MNAVPYDETTQSIQAVAVESYTLLEFQPDEFPSERGNCFRVEGSDGLLYKIVNFNHENLEELEARGLTWPIAMRILRGQTAIFNDARIPEDWYAKEYCEICCPVDLIPKGQKLRFTKRPACNW